MPSNVFDQYTKNKILALSMENKCYKVKFLFVFLKLVVFFLESRCLNSGWKKKFTWQAVISQTGKAMKKVYWKERSRVKIGKF